MKNNILKNTIMYISIILFVVITITNLVHHVPWFDEVHAWEYSRIMNIHNVYSIIKTEGHFIIWYLILMPFAKLHLWYPYSMLFINWLCFFLSIVIMWKKASFNIFAKIIITFSWISLNYYSVVARCYSVGILGLFIIAALYEKQLKRPILYSSVLILTAHTSLIATMAVIPFVMIFVFDLIKDRQNLSKKNIIITLNILLIGIILWIAPFVTGFGRPTQYSYTTNLWEYYINFFSINNYSIFIFYTICLIIPFIYADKKIKFFMLITTAQFYIFHSIFYPALPHNIIFIFIYIIIAYWLTPKIHNIKSHPIATIIFLISFALLLFTNYRYYMKYTLENVDKSNLIEYLNSRPNKEYIYMNWNFTEIIPYLSLKYTHRPISIELEDDCPNKTAYMQNIIQEDLKPFSDNWNAIVITQKRINEKSIPFEWEIKDSASIIWYATTFENK